MGEKFVVEKTGILSGYRWVEGKLNGVPIAITENGDGKYSVSKQDVDGGKPFLVDDKAVSLLQNPKQK